MKWRVRPSTLHGAIAIPPSKSHTIRALLVATLARGTSTIRDALLEGDGESALRVAQSLGAAVRLDGRVLSVTGVGGAPLRGSAELDCGNSGTSMRLFTTAASLGAMARRFDGDGSLRTRPMKPLLDALAGLGARHTCHSAGGDVPFTVQGPIRGGITAVSGRSSQFLSSLLLSCPLAPQDTTVAVEGLNEKPYVELTLWWLRRCGISHSVSPDFTSFSVKGAQSYQPIDLTVPGDFSSATFAAVAAALTGSTVAITGLDFSDPQGDKAIFPLLESFGARVSVQGSTVTVSGAGQLTGRDVDMNAMPDALPAFSVLAAASRGRTRLGNVPQARIKETDRIAVMAQELATLGVRTEQEPDGLIVHGSPMKGGHVNGHGDHRVVMALALAGMRADGATIVDTAESAAVTYPSFAHDFRALGASIEEC